jgi:hypothetical protein
MQELLVKFYLLKVCFLLIMCLGNLIWAQSFSDILLDYPQIVVNVKNNPSDDYIFLGLTALGAGHLLILDNEATPVFYKKIEGAIFDFKWQPNGELTYNIYPDSSYGLDSSGISINRYYSPQGFDFDFHELTVMGDGSYYVLGEELVIVDLSQIVPGGDSNAVLITQNIHHMDSSDIEIWRWRSFDHYDILDADEHVNLTLSYIDWTHCNSIEIDTDGNILLSTRNFNEITKIDRQTGDIIWRFGGERNQFQFINDNRGFSRQHDARRTSTGNIILFDNGVHLLPQYSSLVEYQLNEQNYTATPVRRYSRNESVYSHVRGGVQEFLNGNLLICWGESDEPAVTEISPDNSVLYEISFPTGGHRYRSKRFPWKTNYFSVNTDSLNFGIVPVNDSLIKNIWVKNNKSDSVVINQFYLKDSMFTVLSELPIHITHNDSIKIEVKFKPHREGYFEDRLNIRYVNDTLLLGQQVNLLGSTGVVTVDDKNYNPINAYSLSHNYPNPFNPSTSITFSIPKTEKVVIKVYNQLGEIVEELVNRNFPPGEHVIKFNASRLPSSIYYYNLTAGEFNQTKKLVLIK